jgi:hypothetical protein
MSVFGWLSRFFKNEKLDMASVQTSQPARESPYAAVKVRCENGVIYVEWPEKPVQKVAIDSLIGVAVETSDQGPFVEDVWWHLATSESVATYPSEATGAGELLSQLQALPTFNNERLIQAMGSTQNNMFILWDKQDRHLAP